MVGDALSFSAAELGRYVVVVRPLRGEGVNQGKCLTWSDWGAMMGGSGAKGGIQSVHSTEAVGDATLMVA